MFSTVSTLGSILRTVKNPHQVSHLHAVEAGFVVTEIFHGRIHSNGGPDLVSTRNCAQPRFENDSGENLLVPVPSVSGVVPKAQG